MNDIKSDSLEQVRVEIEKTYSFLLKSELVGEVPAYTMKFMRDATFDEIKRIEKMSFKRIDTNRGRKLKYEGYCSTCEKLTPHRFKGGSVFESKYKCIKCGTINTEKTI